MKSYRTSSFKETQALGEMLGKHIKAGKKGAGATVVALQGNLGAGKTTFVQGVFRGLGIKKRAQSPTFIIMRRHKNIFHIDAYRLKNAKHLEALEFTRIASDPRNVILVEWPERIRRLLPKHTIKILFKHGKREGERIVVTQTPKIFIKK